MGAEMFTGKKIKLAVSVAAAILVAGCQTSEQVYTYRAPGNQEMDLFIDQINIQPLAVASAPDFAVVLFEKDGQAGHYVLYVSEEGRLHKDFSIETYPSPDDVFVSLSLDHSWITTPFAAIIIRDDRILNEAATISAYFGSAQSSPKVVPADGSRGYIILDVSVDYEPGYTVRVVINDSAGNVLFEYQSNNGQH